MIIILIFLSSLISLKSEELYPFIRDEQVGYINSEGKIKIPANLNSDYKLVRYKINGKSLMGVEFDKDIYFSEGVAAFKQDIWLWILFPISYETGYINKSGGKYIIENANDVSSFKNGIARIIPDKEIHSIYTTRSSNGTALR